MKRLQASLLLLGVMAIFPGLVFSQSALGSLESMTNTKVSVPKASSPSMVGGSSLTTIVAGALVQNMINTILSPTPQKTPEQLEAERLEQERIEYEAEMARQAEEARQQELHDNLMNSTKPISGSQDLDFKSLDGGMESMRKEASDQFERGGEARSLESAPKGTDFFGVPLSDAQIATLIDPQSNPVLNDIETAVKTTDDYLEKEKSEAAKEEKEKPVEKSPDCIALTEKLARYESDLIRFQQWNTGTLTELKKWEEQNDAAFWNAVKDGAGAAFGVFADYLNESRKSAALLKKTLEENEGKLLVNQVFSPEEIIKYKKLLDQRITTCNITDLTKFTTDTWSWVNTVQNLIQGTTEKMAHSDADCIKMINALKEQDLLTSTPWVDAGSFLAGETINAFLGSPGITKNPKLYTTKSIIKNQLKIPYVTIVQLAVDETYNAMDMWKSYQNICTFREADGKATEAVKKIESDMNNLKLQIKNCPANN